VHFLDNIKLVVVVTVLLKYIQLGLGLWLVSFFTMILLIIFVIHIYLYWVYSFFIPRCGGTAIMFMSVSLTHAYVSCCKIVAGPTRILFPCNSILNFFLRKKNVVSTACLEIGGGVNHMYACSYPFLFHFLGFGGRGLNSWRYYHVLILFLFLILHAEQ
jgi:hypothetical protein